MTEEIMFAKSLSGHDKNQYYLVIGEVGTRLILTNGNTKPLEKPKTKNEKHLQLIKNIPECVAEIIKERKDNESIRRALKLYVKSIMSN